MGGENELNAEQIDVIILALDHSYEFISGIHKEEYLKTMIEEINKKLESQKKS